MARRKEILPEKVKSRSISAAEKREAVARMEEGIRLSPVLQQLGLYIDARGQHFHLNYDSDDETITMARVTPMADSPAFALENRHDKGWALYGQGTPTRIIKLLCNDTLGTFHALGAIDQTLRNSLGECPEVVPLTPRSFAYKKTRFTCSLQEALYFYYEIPLEVIMEPREWYQIHAEPSLLETGLDGRRILVRFCDRNATSGSKILGHALYALKRNEWWAITLPDEQGQTLQAAEEFVKVACI